MYEQWKFTVTREFILLNEHQYKNLDLILVKHHVETYPRWDKMLELACAHPRQISISIPDWSIYMVEM